MDNDTATVKTKFVKILDISGTAHVTGINIANAVSNYVEGNLDINLLEIVSYKLHHIETYNDNLAIAACETTASFMINGSSRNMDYNMLKKLGPCTMTHKRRNFITLAAFLSNAHTALHSDPLNVRQYAISQNITKSIEVCSEFWKGLSLREENFTLVNTANLVVYTFKNEIKTRNKCTELCFTSSELPCLKIISARVFCDIKFYRLNRTFFTKVTCHMLSLIFGQSEVYQAVIQHTHAIYPEMTISSVGFHISTTRRMIILPSQLLPHNIYNRKDIPDVSILTTICDVARSVAKEILELYPSRVRLYEQTVIQPTIISVFKHPTRLEVNNSFQLISAIVYIHTYLCTRRGTLSFHPHLKLQSMCRSQRLSVNIMNHLIDSILELIPEPDEPAPEPEPEPVPDIKIDTEPELSSPVPSEDNQTVLIEDTDAIETDSDEEFVPSHRHSARVLQSLSDKVYNFRPCNL